MALNTFKLLKACTEQGSDVKKRCKKVDFIKAGTAEGSTWKPKPIINFKTCLVEKTLGCFIIYLTTGMAIYLNFIHKYSN